MPLDQIAIVVQNIANSLMLITVIIMNILIAHKILLEKKETGEWNIIRILIFSILFCYLGLLTSTFFLETAPIVPSPYNNYLMPLPMTFFSVYIISFGIMLAFSHFLVAYANKWESFYYTSFFIFGLMFIFYILTGFEAWLMPYIYISAVISILFIFFTALRLRDNGALGLAIFFTIAFLALIISIGISLQFNIISDLLFFVQSIFGLYFALGKFRPFKERDFQNE